MASTGLVHSVTQHRTLLSALERAEANNYLCCPPEILRIILKASELASCLSATSTPNQILVTETKEGASLQTVTMTTVTPATSSTLTSPPSWSPSMVAPSPSLASLRVVPASAEQTAADSMGPPCSSRNCIPVDMTASGSHVVVTEADEDLQIRRQAAALLQDALAVDVEGWARRVAGALGLDDVSSRIHVAEAHRAAAALYILQVFFPHGVVTVDAADDQDTREQVGSDAAAAVAPLISPPLTPSVAQPSPSPSSTTFMSGRQASGFVGPSTPAVSRPTPTRAMPVTPEALSDHIFELLKAVPPGDPHFKATAWPTFVAGAVLGHRRSSDSGCAEKAQQRREVVLKRLGEVWSACPWGYVFTAIETLRELWRRRDDDEAAATEAAAEASAAGTGPSVPAVDAMGAVLANDPLRQYDTEGDTGVNIVTLERDAVMLCEPTVGLRRYALTDDVADAANETVFHPVVASGASGSMAAIVPAPATANASYNWTTAAAPTGGVQLIDSWRSDASAQQASASAGSVSPLSSRATSAESRHTLGGRHAAACATARLWGHTATAPVNPASTSGLSIGRGWRQELLRSGFDCLIV